MRPAAAPPRSFARRERAERRGYPRPVHERQDLATPPFVFFPEAGDELRQHPGQCRRGGGLERIADGVENTGTACRFLASAHHRGSPRRRVAPAATTQL